MNVQYLDFCVHAEGSNFAIWSSKWTPCDINVEIKKKKHLHKPVFESFLTLHLYLVFPWSPQPHQCAQSWWHPISLLLWQQAGPSYLPFIHLGSTTSPTQRSPLLQAV